MPGLTPTLPALRTPTPLGAGAPEPPSATAAPRDAAPPRRGTRGPRGAGSPVAEGRG